MIAPSTRPKWLLIGVVSIFLGVAGATTAVAERPSAIGWWSFDRPSRTVPSFAPVPSVPEGGLYVASSPAGPAGISALRFRLPLNVIEPTLTLVVAETQGTPLIDSCISVGGWEPAEHGAWDERPVADCSAGKVAGIFSDDGSVVRFDLSGLYSDRVLDLVLTPGADPESSAPPVFSVSFRAPDADALVVRQAAEPSSRPIQEQHGAPAPEGATTNRPPSRPTDTRPDAEAFPAQPVDPPGNPRGLIVNTGSAPNGFAYPVVLGLPLVLLVVGSYLAWVLNRPIAVDSRYAA